MKILHHRCRNHVTLATITPFRTNPYLDPTYLAWLRTGMAMMGFGVVIAKLRYLFLDAALTPLTTGIIHASNIGLLFTVIGLLIVMTSGWRYAVVQNQIRQKSYRSSKHIVIILSIIVIALGVLIIWYLLQDTFPGNRG
jgi:putative membrane protein